MKTLTFGHARSKDQKVQQKSKRLWLALEILMIECFGTLCNGFILILFLTCFLHKHILRSSLKHIDTRIMV